ncbi:unnamed protein product [Clavelina lepadiformis]|uniref:Mucin-like protein n=1 Tax=Clavelina lepadiformis TaxID=159417 RepID=A0ABP0GLB6_CLALP
MPLHSDLATGLAQTDQVPTDSPDLTTGLAQTDQVPTDSPDLTTGLAQTDQVPSDSPDLTTGLTQTDQVLSDSPDLTTGLTQTDQVPSDSSDLTTGLTQTDQVPSDSPDLTTGLAQTDQVPSDSPDLTTGLAQTDQVPTDSPGLAQTDQVPSDSSDLTTGLAQTDQVPTDSPDLTTGLTQTDQSPSNSPDLTTGLAQTDQVPTDSPDLTTGLAQTDQVPSDSPDLTTGLTQTDQVLSDSPDLTTGLTQTDQVPSDSSDLTTGLTQTDQVPSDSPDLTTGLAQTDQVPSDSPDLTTGLAQTDQVPTDSPGLAQTDQVPSDSSDLTTGLAQTDQVPTDSPDLTTGLTQTDQSPSNSPDLTTGLAQTDQVPSDSPDLTTGLTQTDQVLSDSPDLTTGLAQTDQVPTDSPDLTTGLTQTDQVPTDSPDLTTGLAQTDQVPSDSSDLATGLAQTDQVPSDSPGLTQTDQVLSDSPDLTTGLAQTDQVPTDSPDLTTGLTQTDQVPSDSSDFSTGLTQTDQVPSDSPDLTTGLAQTDQVPSDSPDLTTGLAQTDQVNTDSPDLTTGLAQTDQVPSDSSDLATGFAQTDQVPTDSPDLTTGLTQTDQSPSNSPDLTTGLTQTDQVLSDSPDLTTGLAQTDQVPTDSPDLTTGLTQTDQSPSNSPDLTTGLAQTDQVPSDSSDLTTGLAQTDQVPSDSPDLTTCLTQTDQVPTDSPDLTTGLTQTDQVPSDSPDLTTGLAQTDQVPSDSPDETTRTSPTTLVTTTDATTVTMASTGSCASSPCQYGGICFPNGPLYNCSCTENFFGQTCQTFVSPCLRFPCRNKGQCESDRSNEIGYRCVCPDNYEGEICDMDKNECNGNPCAEHANCTNTVGGYSCECNVGFRGDGKEKCYEIILFPYGVEANDILLRLGDDVASSVVTLEYAIPFGSQTFFNIRLTSNGIIYLGTSFYWVQSLYRPSQNGFQGRSRNLALLAPFWDDFHPSFNNDGRVYYQSYDKVSNPSGSTLDTLKKVKRRIDERFGIDFDPIFAYKATWSEVVMYPEYYQTYRDYPSTFQAVLTTDGCNTYLIYLYKEDGMLWKTGIRYTDRGLIGYTNGAELDYIETQGDYRPDQLLQTGSSRRGELFYKLTPSSNSAVQESRCNCLKWYVADLDNYSPRTEHTCPCSSFQARVDGRFVRAVEDYLWYRGKSSLEWSYESFGTECYQERFGTGPRCCYRRRFSFFFSWWSFITSGPLIRGPFGSRSERYQIPISDQNGWIYWRDSTVLDQQYNDALNGDLIPRRQCCIESQSSGYCRLYEERRPAATCFSYFPFWPSFFWGDPHLTTFDGASYTFNGLGEYYLVYAPDVITIQARTKRVLKEDGAESDATGFVAVVVKDHTNDLSGKVLFEVDTNSTGNGIVVKVNEEIQESLNETEKIIESVSLTVSNGSYEAVFPSQQSVTVTASAYLLTIQFTGDPNILQNVSRGLLGFWSGTKSDDFELRNGTVLSFDDIQVTNANVTDVLNGTIAERKVYLFGQSWQITMNESLFTYAGGEDTYATHNPTNSPDPPFLEDLVAHQKGTPLFEEIRTNCTSDGELSTSCLYDTLTTNRSDIGQTTLENGLSSATASAINVNTPPNITVLEADDFADGYLQAKINVTSLFRVTALDLDEEDTISFSLTNSTSILGITINATTGFGSWTPNSDSSSLINVTLEVQAYDGTEYSVVTVPIKLCLCENNGLCLYNMTLKGSENFEIVQCECTDAYSGDYCTDDRNECDGFENGTSPCFTDVSCVDQVAPDSGFDCGVCPTGTTGDGRNCTTINLCDSNPCSQVCSPIFGGFNCSCNDGYRINDTDSTLCDDIDECMESYPCESTFNSECSNTMGNYSCECMEGFQKNGSICVNIDECAKGEARCDTRSTECTDLEGTFECTCKDGYNRTNPSMMLSCSDKDECLLDGICQPNASCSNTAGSFTCTCDDGFTFLDDQCVETGETTVTSPITIQETTGETIVTSPTTQGISTDETTTKSPTPTFTVSDAVSFTAATINKTILEFPVQLIVDRPFSEALLDKNTTEFNELAADVEKTFNMAIELRINSTVDRFLRGSVIAIINVTVLDSNVTMEDVLNSYNETIGGKLFLEAPTANVTCSDCDDTASCKPTNTASPCYCNGGTIDNIGRKFDPNVPVQCVDQCSSEYYTHCLNGAECVKVDEVGYPNCKCRDGFTGYRCRDQSWIAGVVLGVLAGVFLIAACVMCYFKRRGHSSKYLLTR